MKKTSRRGFGKQLSWALGAMPLVSLIGGTVEAKKRKPFDGDSPITVGGGGGKRARNLTAAYTDIYFAHDDYVLKDDTYDQNPLLELHVVSVGRQNHWTNYSVSTDTRVEIEYLIGTTRRMIVINNGGKMGVTFKQDDFLYDVAIKKHHGGRAEINKLTIGGVERPLPENGNFEIVAHTQAKPTKRGKKS